MTAKPITELYKDFSPEQLAEIEEGKQLLLLEHDLINYLLPYREVTDTEIEAIEAMRDIAFQKMAEGEDYQLDALMDYLKILGEADPSLTRFREIIKAMGYKLRLESLK